MRSGLVKESTAIALIHGLCQHKKFHQAKTILQSLLFRSHPASLSKPTSKLSYPCFSSRAPERAHHLFDEILVGISVPSPSCYNYVIRSLCSNGLLHDARTLLATMVKRGCSPNVASFSPLVNVLLAPETMLDAFYVFMDMLNLVTYLNSEIILLGHDLMFLLVDGYSPTYVVKLIIVLYRRGYCFNFTYMRHVVKSMMLQGSVDECMHLIEELEIMGHSFDFGIYRIVVASLGVWGRMKELNLMLGKMDNIDESYKTIVCNTLLDSLCKVGLLEEAKDILGWMRENGINPNSVTYGTLVDGFCEFGRVDVAASLLDETIEKNCMPNAVVYTAYMKGLCKVGMVDGAFELLKIMKECNCSPTLYTYNVLIYGLCKSGKILEAEKVAGEMGSEGFIPNVFTYESVVDGLRQSGNEFYSGTFFQKLAELRVDDSKDLDEITLLEKFSLRRK